MPLNNRCGARCRWAGGCDAGASAGRLPAEVCGASNEGRKLQRTLTGGRKEGRKPRETRSGRRRRGAAAARGSWHVGKSPARTPAPACLLRDALRLASAHLRAGVLVGALLETGRCCSASLLAARSHGDDRGYAASLGPAVSWHSTHLTAHFSSSHGVSSHPTVTSGRVAPLPSRQAPSQLPRAPFALLPPKTPWRPWRCLWSSQTTRKTMTRSSGAPFGREGRRRRRRRGAAPQPLPAPLPGRRFSSHLPIHAPSPRAGWPSTRWWRRATARPTSSKK